MPPTQQLLPVPGSAVASASPFLLPCCSRSSTGANLCGLANGRWSPKEHPSPAVWHGHCPSLAVWHRQYPSRTVWHGQCPGPTVWHRHCPSPPVRHGQCPNPAVQHRHCPSPRVQHRQCPSSAVWHGHGQQTLTALLTSLPNVFPFNTFSSLNPHNKNKSFKSKDEELS